MHCIARDDSLANAAPLPGAPASPHSHFQPATLDIASAAPMARQQCTSPNASHTVAVAAGCVRVA
jgi:hypothetical protein